MEIIKVDYGDEKQAADLCALLNGYAMDPKGGGEAIDAENLQKLPSKLKDFPTAASFILYDNGKPAALANTFLGFSTFAAQELLNIHDIYVAKEFRGKGYSQKMLQACQDYALSKNCCKITLEVQDKNTPAMNAYRKFGFAGYELDPVDGKAMFWQKKLK